MSRFSLSRALIVCWNKNLSLACALLIAVDSEVGVKLSSDEFDELLAEAIALYPKCWTTHTILGQSSRTFIASHFREANDLLWQGKKNYAHKRIMLSSGIRSASGLLSIDDRAEIAKDKRSSRGVTTIHARSLTKDHDWGMVK